MPYFIFDVQPFAQPKPVAAYPTFPEASTQAKALRAGRPPGQGRRIRVVFADDELTAEDLLLQPREAPPDGDD